MIISLIFGLILGAVAVVFVFQNMTSITVAFLSWEIEGSLALILILTMAVGAIIALLFSLPESIKKSFKILDLNKQIRALKEELKNKNVEVELEKSKLDANNAYLDDLEKNPKV